MKRKPLAQNTMELRNLTRHKMPPPTTAFRDRKKESNKNACR